MEPAVSVPAAAEPRPVATPAGGEAAVGRRESDASAVGGGQADGTGGVGADGGEAEASGNAGGRASRRASGNARRVPWIVDLAEEADHRTAAVGEFVQVLLA